MIVSYNFEFIHQLLLVMHHVFMCFLDNIQSLRRKRFRALVGEYGGLVDDGLLLRMVGYEAELNDGLGAAMSFLS